MKFGQFISSSQNTSAYYSSITPDIKNDITTINQIYRGSDYKDTCIYMSDGFNSGSSYFLEFQIKSDENNNNTNSQFNLELYNSNSELTKYLRNYNAEDQYAKFNLNTIYQQLISPKANYTHLFFIKTNRNQGDTSSYGNLFIVNKFYTINNLCGNSIPQTIKKLSVQGRPGLQMCINGENIKVGKNGIYELNNGIDVTFLGFVPQSGEKFIVNYEYEN